jgi:hypothetical protein
MTCNSFNIFGVGLLAASVKMSYENVIFSSRK